MRGPTEPQLSPASRKRKITLYQKHNILRKLASCQSCVVVVVGAGLWTHVVLCSYVSRGGSRFTYCMLTNSEEEDICCSSSTTLHSIHFIQYSYPFPLLGKQLATSGSTPGFIKLKWVVGRLAGVSIPFVAFWTSPLSAHR